MAKSFSPALVVLYLIAALTLASFGYGIGGMPALIAGALYALIGLVLAIVCVGLAPRFIIVIAFATGMLGSILRASSVAGIVSLLPRQTTVEYLRAIVTVCGAISFGGGLYGGFQFTGSGLFNWISKLAVRHSEVLDISDPSPQERVLRVLSQRFKASERMYFSLVAAAGSTLIAWVELSPVRRSLLIIFLAVLVAGNLCWALGAWLKPRLTVLAGVFRILAQMWEALLAFLVGYIAIVFIFACLYSAAWQLNHAAAFRGSFIGPNPHFADFIYFSVVTMATVGYGDIVPSDSVTRVLVCCQVVLGLGWVTIVLTTAASLARPRVDQMLRQEWAAAGETVPEDSGIRSKAKITGS